MITARYRNAFLPVFSITATVARDLMRIEAVRKAIQLLPVTPRVLANLRETARLFSTHYSTMIEGNQLTHGQVIQVIGGGSHYPGRERDQEEVKGYYAALEAVERLAAKRTPVTERTVRHIHALVMGRGRVRVKPTPYRDGQNVITDARSQAIVYMPPEAHDVPGLMKQFIAWINRRNDLPAPLRAGIAHCQFATIHPYYDGNGRTARLLTTLILHLGGYDLKGIYALEEYYARDLNAYYRALTIGPSHNYYLGRANADITPWVSYFIAGMADAFERVQGQAARASAAGATDQSKLLRGLDARQRRALHLFRSSREITAKEIGALFGYQPRTATQLCRRWVSNGFLVTVDPSRKTRRYGLDSVYDSLIDR
ncbi:MAG: Fic family protein [Acidobacteria bacterium]|nr:Fic family protein [Acidobacteriota bacterium]